MALRVKNIAAGFYDAHGFHPIRRSPDYDPDRAGDDYGAAKDNIGLRYKRSYSTAARRKAKAKAKPKARKRASKRTSTPAKWFSPSAPDSALVARQRGKKSRTLAYLRAKNPIPTKWVAANVKRVGNDIQVMLFPKGKVAKRRAAKRRVARRRR